MPQYHWRQKSNCEVDLVYDHPEEPLAFEITADHHVRGMAALQKQFPRFRGSCYLVSDRPDLERPTQESPGRLPLDSFLTVVGRQEQLALESRLGRIHSSGDGQKLLF